MYICICLFYSTSASGCHGLCIGLLIFTCIMAHFYSWYGKQQIYRGSYMSAHVLLNLSNELGKRDEMLGKPRILSRFPNSFNKFNYTGAWIIIWPLNAFAFDLMIVWLRFCHIYVTNMKATSGLSILMHISQTRCHVISLHYNALANATRRLIG